MSDHDGLILLTCPESLADDTYWLICGKSIRAKNYINYTFTHFISNCHRSGALIKSLVVNQNIVTVGVNFVECLNSYVIYI